MLKGITSLIRELLFHGDSNSMYVTNHTVLHLVGVPQHQVVILQRQLQVPKTVILPPLPHRIRIMEIAAKSKKT